MNENTFAVFILLNFYNIQLCVNVKNFRNAISLSVEIRAKNIIKELKIHNTFREVNGNTQKAFLNNILCTARKSRLSKDNI